MKSEIEIPEDALSDELKALFDNTPATTVEKEKELADAIRRAQQDPAFQAELMKARVVEAVLEGMEARQLNRNQLAGMWNKSRQYVGRILDETRKANFTLETISELLHLVGKRVEIQIRDLAPGSEAFPPGSRNCEALGAVVNRRTGRGGRAGHQGPALHRKGHGPRRV